MALQKMGLNVSNLKNITAPSFDIKNTTEQIVNDIPAKANEVSGGWLGAITLGSLFTYLIWKLKQDRGDGGDYGYSTLRSIGISSGICSIVGIYALNLGYFTNYYHVAIFIIMTFIMIGTVWKSQS